MFYYLNNASMERRSRQNYFCQVVAMKEKSGSHFPLPLELKKRQNNRNDRLSCKENEHKCIPFILNKKCGMSSKFMKFLSVKYARRHCICTQRHDIHVNFVYRFAPVGGVSHVWECPA